MNLDQLKEEIEKLGCVKWFSMDGYRGHSKYFVPDVSKKEFDRLLKILSAALEVIENSSSKDCPRCRKENEYEVAFQAFEKAMEEK